MRTIFDLGMRQSPWNPSLGQDGAVIPTGSYDTTSPSVDWKDLFETGSDIYKSYTDQEIAEDKRKAEEAKVAAAQAAAAAAAAAAGKSKGIPTSYLLIGGASLAAIALVAVLLSKKK